MFWNIVIITLHHLEDTGIFTECNYVDKGAIQGDYGASIDSRVEWYGMGICQHLQHKRLHGPLEVQAIESPHLYTIQCLAHAADIILHTAKNSNRQVELG